MEFQSFWSCSATGLGTEAVAVDTDLESLIAADDEIADFEEDAIEMTTGAGDEPLDDVNEDA